MAITVNAVAVETGVWASDTRQGKVRVLMGDIRTHVRRLLALTMKNAKGGEKTSIATTFFFFFAGKRRNSEDRTYLELLGVTPRGRNGVGGD